ncbi:MAG: hypothetical protein IPF55_04835 [Rhodoferax sp.]|nr:hypothetical protein [Rhodoferax sp.]
MLGFNPSSKLNGFALRLGTRGGFGSFGGLSLCRCRGTGRSLGSLPVRLFGGTGRSFTFGLGSGRSVTFGLGAGRSFTFGLGAGRSFTFGLGAGRSFAFGLGAGRSFAFGLGSGGGLGGLPLCLCRSTGRDFALSFSTSSGLGSLPSRLFGSANRGFGRLAFRLCGFLLDGRKRRGDGRLPLEHGTRGRLLGFSLGRSASCGVGRGMGSEFSCVALGSLLFGGDMNRQFSFQPGYRLLGFSRSLFGAAGALPLPPNQGRQDQGHQKAWDDHPKKVQAQFLQLLLVSARSSFAPTARIIAPLTRHGQQGWPCSLTGPTARLTQLALLGWQIWPT